MPPVAVAIGAAISAAATAVIAATTALISTVVSFASIATFLASPFGTLVLGIGLSLVTSLFIKRPSAGSAPSIEASRVNVRLAEPERWLVAGQIRQGGGVVFGEFDEEGNFWYVIVHCDSNLESIEKHYFDNVKLEILDDGTVVSDEFTLTKSGDSFDRNEIENFDPITNTSTRTTNFGEIVTNNVQQRFFQIFTTTFNQTNPIPDAITTLTDAFPGIWTEEHRLVGTTYTAIKIKPVKTADRFKIFRWRGPMGLGEPSYSIVGNWSHVYDPRDVAQDISDPETYKTSRNPALIWAWYRTHPYGRNKPMNSVNWEKVGEMADICDIPIVDISGNTTEQYKCDVAIPESTTRSSGEQQILLACDAQLVFDDDGKVWPRVGYYYDSDVKLVRNRDIVAMESVEANDGETLTQGVIVRYIDPENDYTTQPSAPYVNPLYFVEGEVLKYIVVDALTIQDHRQAMQLAKSISKRSQSEYKLMPTTGLRGLRARQERIVDLIYDNIFSGPHEIVTTVGVDPIGAFCGFGCVPIDEFRWQLLPGEERPKAESNQTVASFTPLLPTNVSLSFSNNRIEATYDEPPRPDWFYLFQYQPVVDINQEPIETEWLDMDNSSSAPLSFSNSVMSNVEYYVRWRTVSTGGSSSNYVDPVATVLTSGFTLSGTPVEIGQVGVTYSNWSITATGGSEPYLFVDLFDKLPQGLSINSSTGEISGTPSQVENAEDIIIRVQDNFGLFVNFDNFDINITN